MTFYGDGNTVNSWDVCEWPVKEVVDGEEREVYQTMRVVSIKNGRMIVLKDRYGRIVVAKAKDCRFVSRLDRDKIKTEKTKRKMEKRSKHD